MNGIYHLQGTVKHYDWGGKNFIPGLLQLPNPGKLPFAEYWLGMHSLGVSTITTPEGKAEPITVHIERLPYLLKILDVHSMLSIQVHPAKKAAELAFAAENAAGIPVDSPQRNYKDDNHKPELMVALDDFWLLHGFKTPEKLLHTLYNTPELKSLIPVFGSSDYRSLYKHIMEMPQPEVNRILLPLISRVARDKGRNEDAKNEDYWAALAAETFSSNDVDRGIFSIYLFNIVHLQKGEGVFQAAGVPHAYLRGQNVEIMANSDNVLRGGLTTKHIDVPELLKHVKCEATIPVILASGSSAREKKYPAPVPDFSLTGYDLESGGTLHFTSNSFEMVLLTSGSVVLESGTLKLQLGAGHPAALVSPGQAVSIKAVTPATIFRAGEAVHNG